MTDDETSNFARSVAAECDAAATSLARLQRSLGGALPDLEVSNNLNVQMQTLDGVHQTLSDLARIFAAIAQARLQPNGAIPPDVLEAARQRRLRQTLAGAPDDGVPGSVDLF